MHPSWLFLCIVVSVAVSLFFWWKSRFSGILMNGSRQIKAVIFDWIIYNIISMTMSGNLSNIIMISVKHVSNGTNSH